MKGRAKEIEQKTKTLKSSKGAKAAEQTKPRSIKTI
jgi:hypothetical protein